MKEKEEAKQKNVQEMKEEWNKITKLIEKILSKVKFDEIFTVMNGGKSYKLGNDSKIISKIYECVLIEELKNTLKKEGYDYIENEIQNKYPDFIIASKKCENKYYAVDIKSTYLKSAGKLNGFTLGTYKGYFLNRSSLNSIVKPYNQFLKHYCICVIYERKEDKLPVKEILLREKWQIATKGVGSGNTCNIGSIKSLDQIKNHTYCFKNEEEFDRYWLKY